MLVKTRVTPGGSTVVGLGWGPITCISFYLTEVYSIYNVVLVSGVQQSFSVCVCVCVCVYIYIYTHIMKFDVKQSIVDMAIPGIGIPEPVLSLASLTWTSTVNII